MLGVRPQLLELPSGVRDLYEVVISHLRERAHLAATARGVFNPHLIGDQPIAQSASAVAPQELAELLHARLQPVSPYACPQAPPAPGPRPTAAQPAASYLAEVLHKALSPSSPSVSPPEALPPRPRLPSPPSPLPGSADPRGVGTREPFTAPSAKRRLHERTPAPYARSEACGYRRPPLGPSCHPRGWPSPAPSTPAFELWPLPRGAILAWPFGPS